MDLCLHLGTRNIVNTKYKCKRRIEVSSQIGLDIEIWAVKHYVSARVCDKEEEVGGSLRRSLKKVIRFWAHFMVVSISNRTKQRPRAE